MTLTTEQLKHILDNPNEFSLSQVQEMAAELLANREAQPVIVVGDDGGDALAYRRLIQSFAPGTKLYAAPPAPEITDEVIDRIVVPLSPDGLDEEKYPCEWHLYHDRERIRNELRKYFAAPPAPAVPDGYCVMPLTLTAANGAKGALSGEFKVSRTVRCHECGGEGCDDCGDAGEFEEEITVPWDTIKDIYRVAVDACRAAMLAQPVSQRYTLPNAWIPRDERMPKDGDVVLVFQEGGIIFCAEVDDGEFYPDEFPRVPTQGREITHWMPLPAAPEVSRDDA